MFTLSVRSAITAAGVVGAATLVKLALNQWVDQSGTPFLLYFLAILLSGWRGGFGGGAFATVLSLVSAYALFVPHDSGSAIPLLVVFGLEGLLASYVAHRVIVSAWLLREEADRRADALRELERRTDDYRVIFEQGAAGMAHVALDGRFMRVNRQFCEMTGFESSELLNRRAGELTHPEDLLLQDPKREALERGEIETYTMEKRYIGKGGGEVWVALSVSLARATDGTPLYFLTVANDITEIRRLRDGLDRANARIESHLRNTPLAVIEWDEDFRVMRWSGQAEAMFGWSEQEVLGTHPVEWSLVHEDDRESVAHAIEALHSGKEERNWLVNRNLTKAGEVLWCAWYNSAVRYEDGRLTSLLSLVLDVTSERRVKEEMEKLNSELEVRVSERTSELEKANAELQNFAYVASHDLKEPLRTVASYTQLLERRYKGALDQDAKEFMSFIVSAVTRMQRLIDDILHLSRLGRGTLKVKESNLAEVIGSVLDDLQLRVEETRMEIDVDVGAACVVGDVGKLEQMFRNLVENAMKFSPAGKRIVIHANRSGEYWEVAIEDEGIGIEERHRERVFGIFQRLHTQEEYDGTGIGLAVCKRIAEAHGGTIRFEDARQLTGARVVVTLPAA